MNSALKDSYIGINLLYIMSVGSYSALRCTFVRHTGDIAQRHIEMF